MIHKQYYVEQDKVEKLIARKNQKSRFYNGIYDRYLYPVLTRVRNTAAGLRYVLYLFGTDLKDPSKVIAQPSGTFLVPLGKERVGDVSNVVFTNGAIARENGDVSIYYASSDTRMHVATTTIDKLEHYLFDTPQDPKRSPDCVRQRCELIEKNLKLLRAE